MFRSDSMRSAPLAPRPADEALRVPERVVVEPGCFESSFDLAHGLEVVEADDAELLSLFGPEPRH